jgi:hypothetical protein
MTHFTIAVNHIIIPVIMTVSKPLWTVVSTCEQGENQGLFLICAAVLYKMYRMKPAPK